MLIVPPADKLGSPATDLPQFHQILSLSIAEAIRKTPYEFLLSCLREMLEQCTKNPFKAVILLFVLRLVHNNKIRTAISK